MKSGNFLRLSVFLLFFSPLFLFAQSAETQNLESSSSAVLAQSLEVANQECDGAGYSWISQDGLRLYFTGDAGKDKLFYAERENPEASFSKPSTIDFSLSRDVLSPWLNETETEIWFVVREKQFETSTTLCHASRKSKNDPWGEVDYVETDLEDSFIAGPSLSQDGKELFLYEAGDGNSVIWLIGNVKEGFKKQEELYFGAMELTGSGQLSADGLRFFIGLRDPMGKEDLYFVERKEAGQKFDTQTLHKLEINAPEDGQKPFQPSVWEAGNQVFYTRNLDGSWEGNTLWSSTFQPEETESVDLDSLGIPEEKPMDDFLAEFEWVDWEYEMDENTVVVMEEEEEIVLIEPLAKVEEEKVENEVAPELPLVNLVYPNPSKDIFNFEIQLPSDVAQAQLEILTLEGQVIQSLPVQPGQDKVAVNLAGNASGTYLYRLTTDAGTSANGRLVLIQ